MESTVSLPQLHVHRKGTMPPRVIEDSDDDDDEKSIASVQSSNKIRLMRAPELNTASPASTIPVSMQQHATSSTGIMPASSCRGAANFFYRSCPLPIRL